jgi:hypothetical protein
MNATSIFIASITMTGWPASTIFKQNLHDQTSHWCQNTPFGMRLSLRRMAGLRAIIHLLHAQISQFVCNGDGASHDRCVYVCYYPANEEKTE